MKVKEIKNNLIKKYEGVIKKDIGNYIAKRSIKEIYEKLLESDKSHVYIRRGDYGVELKIYENTNHEYLLDFRIFNEVADVMLVAELEIVNDNFRVLENYVDDVWSYSHWKIA